VVRLRRAKPSLEVGGSTVKRRASSDDQIGMTSIAAAHSWFGSLPRYTQALWWAATFQAALMLAQALTG